VCSTMLPSEASHSQYEMKAVSVNSYGQLTPTKGILPRRADARIPLAPTAIYEAPGELYNDFVDVTTEAVVVGNTEDWSDDEIEVDIIMEQDRPVDIRPALTVPKPAKAAKTGQGRGGGRGRRGRGGKRGGRRQAEEAQLNMTWQHDDTAPVDVVSGADDVTDIGGGERGHSYDATIDEVLGKYNDDVDYEHRQSPAPGLRESVMITDSIQTPERTPEREAVYDRVVDTGDSEGQTWAPTDSVYQVEDSYVEPSPALPVTKKKKRDKTGSKKKKGDRHSTLQHEPELVASLVEERYERLADDVDTRSPIDVRSSPVHPPSDHLSARESPRESPPPTPIRDDQPLASPVYAASPITSVCCYTSCLCSITASICPQPTSTITLSLRSPRLYSILRRHIAHLHHLRILPHRTVTSHPLHHNLLHRLLSNHSESRYVVRACLCLISLFLYVSHVLAIV
jgi:hypothetical protein